MGTTSQKLTYLSETKSQLKDMINYGLDTGEKITSETTFRNYVKSLFDAFIKTMTYPDVLYNNLPKVTGEGTSVTLNDTVYAPMRVELSPSALEQETSILPSGYTQVDYIESTGTQYIDTGVKLSPNYGFDIKFLTNNALSATTGYGCILGGRNSSGNKDYQLTTYSLTGYEGTIRLGADYGSGRINAKITINTIQHCSLINQLYIAPDNSQTQLSSTAGQSDYNCYLFGLNNGTSGFSQSGNGCRIYYCKLYDGSTLIRNFVPCYRNSDNEIGMYDLANDVFYTNQGTGTFTKGSNSVLPTPDYPQEIHTVSGENTITIENKNLLKLNEFSGTFNTTTYTTMGNYLKIKNRYNNIGRTINVDTNYFKSTRTSTYDNIQDWLFTNLLPNTTYTVSCDIKTDKQSGKMTIFGKQLDYDATSTNTTFTTNSNGEFTSSVFYETNQVSGTYIELSNIQLEKNNQATTYVPHQEQTYPINLGDLEYCKIGNYEDEFYKATESDTGLTAGKWYLKKNIEKKQVLSTDDIAYDSNNKVFMDYYFKNKYNHLGIPYCNYFQGIESVPNNGSAYSRGDNKFALRYSNGTMDRAYFTKYDTTDLTTFKNWIDTIDLYVYYVLATPTYTLLSDTLQTQLEAIWRANSYEEQTNVSQENADLPFVIKLSAIEDLG